MIIVRCIPRGGLGNQIFSYLASCFVSENISGSCLQVDDSEYRHDSFRLSLLASGFSNYEHFLAPTRPRVSLNQKIVISAIDKLLHRYYFPRKLFSMKMQKLLARQFALTGNASIEQRGEDCLLTEVMSRELAIALSAIHQSCSNDFVVSVNDYWQDPRIYLDRLSGYSDLLFEAKQKDLPFEPGSYIGIHLRKGDYYSSIDHMQEYGSRHSPIGFIQSCLGLLPSDLRDLEIVLVSDDPLWCQKWSGNLSGFAGRVHVIGSIDDPWRDWHLLNNARLNIISNSTFSFTASMLNKVNADEKLRVIMPRWYSSKITSYHKGWLSIPGSLDL